MPVSITRKTLHPTEIFVPFERRPGKSARHILELESMRVREWEKHLFRCCATISNMAKAVSLTINAHSVTVISTNRTFNKGNRSRFSVWRERWRCTSCRRNIQVTPSYSHLPHYLHRKSTRPQCHSGNLQ